MEYDNSILQNAKSLMISRFPRFASQIANVDFLFSDKTRTACTDGEDIYINPNFFNSLSNEDRLFTMAHELMHIRFEHMHRLRDKQGNMRELSVWNYATDAIINANLERDGFKIIEGCINMPEALKYTSEELYEKLLKDKQRQEKQNSENQESSGQQTQSEKGSRGEGNGEGKDGKENKTENNKSNDSNKEYEDDLERDKKTQGKKSEEENGSQCQKQSEKDTDKPNNQGGANNNQSKDYGEEQMEDKSLQDGQFSQSGRGDGQHRPKNDNRQLQGDHSLWEEAYNKRYNKKDYSQEETKHDEMMKKIKNFFDEKSKDHDEHDFLPTVDKTIENEFDEKMEFDRNRIERKEKIRQRFRDIRSNNIRKNQIDRQKTQRYENGVGEEKNDIPWYELLNKKCEREESFFTQARSIAENNYAYRLYDMEKDEKISTEIMIDISGSVSEKMVRAWLQRVKSLPNIKETEIKVGFFADRASQQFVPIKTKKDVDEIEFPNVGCGTNLDAPVRAFSREESTNRIVFTDGECCNSDMPKDDLKGFDVIWLVYGNENFEPCCGTVINVDISDVKKDFYLIQNDDLEIEQSQ